MASSLIDKDVKNKIDHDLTALQYLGHGECLCAEFLKMTNVVTMASELVNLI